MIALTKASMRPAFVLGEGAPGQAGVRRVPRVREAIDRFARGNVEERFPISRHFLAGQLPHGASGENLFDE